MTFPDPNRRQEAAARRNNATQLSTAVEHPEQIANEDESSPYVLSFTKGLLHCDNGLLNDPRDFEAFRDGTQSEDPAVFQRVLLNLNTKVIKAEDIPIEFRQWESPTAGLAYVLEGPDPLALTMPPAPPAGSAEFAAEIAEIYQMALCRDWQIAAFMDAALVKKLKKLDGSALPNDAKNRLNKAQGNVKNAADRLTRMRWFSGQRDQRDRSTLEQRRRRRFGSSQSPANMFRGEGEDRWATPFLSQFMVMGAANKERKFEHRSTGFIAYGNQRIDQKVKIARPKKDYMTTWFDWLDVQNALNVRDYTQDEYQETGKAKNDKAFDYRPMARLRDMATHVHDDQLYQTYLNATLILLTEEFGFDPGIPYHGDSDTDMPRWNRKPFALFGGPHLLTLVTEVSSRALKAVRSQKFSVHRRLRPEAAGALFHTIYSGYSPNREHDGEPYAQGDGSIEATARAQLGNTLATYTFPTGRGTDPVLEEILTDIRLHNAKQNDEDPNNLDIAKWLLPMAFPEGSPMHPAYGAGHATVAGACVTLLKAFFNMCEPNDPTTPVYLVEPGGKALVPDGGDNACASSVDLLAVEIPEGLTLEGELNKMMWNVSNSRNIAGVHYYTDYIESALLGESITIGILREQMQSYDLRENVSMTVPLLVKRSLPDVLLNGGTIASGEEVEAIRIDKHGHLHAADPTPRP